MVWRWERERTASPAERSLRGTWLFCRLRAGAPPPWRNECHVERLARYLGLPYAQQDQETMGALFLDVRNRLIGESEVFRDTLSRAAVEPRGILKEALLRSASAFLIFHTHPSGDPSPSAEDLTFTRRMAEAGELVGVRLVDHIVLGSAGRWVSLGRRGAW